MQSPFTEEQLDYFLHIKVQQVVDASKRTIYPYTGLVIFSFILLSHVYISHFGWTKHQMSDIDEAITNAENGLRAASCSKRICRYHFGLAKGYIYDKNKDTTVLSLGPYFELGIPLAHYEDSFNVLLLDSSQVDSVASGIERWGVNAHSEIYGDCTHLDSTRIEESSKKLMSLVQEHPELVAQQLKIEKQAIQVLEKERQNLIDQRSREQTIEVPIIGVYLNLGDLGVLGQLGLILLLIFYYACVRRELHALNEFIILHLQPKSGNKKKLKRRFVIFSEPNFKAHHYYLAYEAFSQYFVFISSTKRLRLGKYNTLLMYFPTVVVGVSLLIDITDLIIHYEGIVELDRYFLRLSVHFILTIVVLFLNIRNYRTQSNVTRCLRAFGDISKGYFNEVRFQETQSDLAFYKGHKFVNGVVELLENEATAQPKIVLRPLRDETEKDIVIGKLSIKNRYEMLTWSFFDKDDPS